MITLPGKRHPWTKKEHQNFMKMLSAHLQIPEEKMWKVTHVKQSQEAGWGKAIGSGCTALWKSQGLCTAPGWLCKLLQYMPGIVEIKKKATRWNVPKQRQKLLKMPNGKTLQKKCKKVWRIPQGPCGDTLWKIPGEKETRRVSKQYPVKHFSVRLWLATPTRVR